MNKNNDGTDLSDVIEQPDGKRSTGLCFDDVPLNEILYCTEQREPTRAGLYLESRKLVDALIKAAQEKDYSGAAQQALHMEQLKPRLSVPMYMKIVRACGELLPVHPLPIIQHDLSPLVHLLSGIWQIAIEKGNRHLQEIAALPLSRCMEMENNYEESRKALLQLRNIQKEKGNLVEEASALNNYAFTYWAEKRYSEAVPLFREAVEKFQAAKAYLRVTNAKSNYWDCYVQVAPDVNLVEAEAVAHELVKDLKDSYFWQKRKPFLLLSRIRKRQGRINAAIRFAREACKLSENQSTGLTQIDNEWLASLLALQ